MCHRGFATHQKKRLGKHLVGVESRIGASKLSRSVAQELLHAQTALHEEGKADRRIHVTTADRADGVDDKRQGRTNPECGSSKEDSR